MAKTIALVSQIPLLPTNAGNRARILALVRELQRLGHAVIYIQIPSADGDEAGDCLCHEQVVGQGNFVDLTGLSLWGRTELWFRKLPSRVVTTILKTLQSNADLRFWQGLDSRVSGETVRAVYKTVTARHCDCCIVEYVFNSTVLEMLPGNILRLIDTHDRLSNRHRSYAVKDKHGDCWISIRPEDERRGLCRADGVIAIQAEEARDFGRLLADSKKILPAIATVSHIVPDEHPQPIDMGQVRAAFIGTAHPANQEAYQLILDHILPRVLVKIPEFRLVLAGGICSTVPDHPNVIKYGRFNRVTDVFAQASISLNPVTSGSGVAIKVLESIASGVPVLATATGARGLESMDGRGIRVVPDGDWQTFADLLCDLVLDSELRRRQGQSAFAMAQLWNASQRQALIEALAISPRTPGCFDVKGGVPT